MTREDFQAVMALRERLKDELRSACIKTGHTTWLECSMAHSVVNREFEYFFKVLASGRSDG